MKNCITLLFCGILVVVCLGCGGTSAKKLPVADAGPDQTVIDADRDGSEEVKLDGSGSRDEKGKIIGWTWSDKLRGRISDSASPSVKFDVGTHTVKLTVIDNKGNVGTDTVEIKVEHPILYTADSVNSGPAGCANAFDERHDTFWETNTPFPHWVVIDFGPERRNVEAYTLQTGNQGKDGKDSTGRMPKEWQFEGSNDGEDWTVLDRQTDQIDWQVNEERTYHCSSPGSFRYHRLYITDGVDARILRLYRLDFATQPDPNAV